MRILFVNPPSLFRFKDDLSPPLWCLILGSIGRQAGCVVQVLDLNLEVLDGHAPADEDLYHWTLRRIRDFQPDLVGFSSMAVNSHLGIVLGEMIKRQLPTAKLIYGGPHFGLIPDELFENFPWIDFVATGEADVSFRLLLESGLNPHGIPGIRYHNSNPISPTLVLPEEVPFPDYSLVDVQRYFRVNPARLLDFDGGQRGCVFACKFCYAPDHIGRSLRHQVVDKYIEGIRQARDLGAQHLFVVQDNFVNRPLDTIELCKRIASEKLNLTFHCYSTLAQLSSDVATALGSAGCKSVYVGVDAVSKTSKAAMAKQLFKTNDDLTQRILACLKNGIKPTTAFLIEPPSVNREGVEETIATAMEAKTAGCDIRFNTVSIYPGTALYRENKYDFHATNVKTRHMDLPPVIRENPLAERLPGLFPFHSTHFDDTMAYARFLYQVDLLISLIEFFPHRIAKLAEIGKCWDLVDYLSQNVDAEHETALPEPLRRKMHIERFNSLVRRVE